MVNIVDWGETGLCVYLRGRGLVFFFFDVLYSYVQCAPAYLSARRLP